MKSLAFRSVLHGPRVFLCRSEAEFRRVAKTLSSEENPPFVLDGATATSHHYHPIKGADFVSVVCVQSKKMTQVEVAGILAHEAVHVWRRYCEFIGEKDAGEEMEAYGIQSIFQALLEAWK